MQVCHERVPGVDPRIRGSRARVLAGQGYRVGHRAPPIRISAIVHLNHFMVQVIPDVESVAS
jgi:hypothetical protein